MKRIKRLVKVSSVVDMMQKSIDTTEVFADAARRGREVAHAALMHLNTPWPTEAETMKVKAQLREFLESTHGL